MPTEPHMHEPIDNPEPKFGEVSGRWWSRCRWCEQPISKSDRPDAVWFTDR